MARTKNVKYEPEKHLFPLSTQFVFFLVFNLIFMIIFGSQIDDETGHIGWLTK